jgi:hypothetical protein
LALLQLLQQACWALLGALGVQRLVLLSALQVLQGVCGLLQQLLLRLRLLA